MSVRVGDMAPEFTLLRPCGQGSARMRAEPWPQEVSGAGLGEALRDAVADAGGGAGDV